MLFEDHPNSPLSRLLKVAYGEEWDFEEKDFDDIVRVVGFTRGNRGIVRYLKGNYHKYDMIVIFVDVMPDNYKTIREYNNCLVWCKKHKELECYVIPIPCIEYCAIAAFIPEVDYKELNAIRDFNDYRECRFNYRGYQLSTVDFEHFCKTVLSSYKNCYHGRFFKEACTCASGDYLGCEQYELDRKAWRLVTKLPAFVTGRVEKWFCTKVVDMVDVEKCAVEAYNKVYVKYEQLGLVDEGVGKLVALHSSLQEEEDKFIERLPAVGE